MQPNILSHCILSGRGSGRGGGGGGGTHFCKEFMELEDRSLLLRSACDSVFAPMPLSESLRKGLTALVLLSSGSCIIPYISNSYPTLLGRHDRGCSSEVAHRGRRPRCYIWKVE